MAKYAPKSPVPAAQSRAEIEALICDRAGATHYAPMKTPEGTRIVFVLDKINYVIPVVNVTRDDEDVKCTPNGQERTSENAIETAFKQKQRSVWRAVALLVKALVVAHEEGLIEGGFSHMMAGFTVLPNGEDLYTYTSRIRREDPACLQDENMFQKLLPPSSGRSD